MFSKSEPSEQIGFRCNTDSFLIDYLNIRKYSSPFSYMVIDIQTALEFINNNFLDFINLNNIDRIPLPHDYTWNNEPWKRLLFIHKLHNVNKNVNDSKRVCVWIHHDLSDKKIKTSINARSIHILDVLNNKPETLLLFYIENIQYYDPNKDFYFNIELLKDFNCNFLIVIPLQNFNQDPYLFHNSGKIKIIYFNSSSDGNIVDINYNIEDWKKLKIMINSLYEFDIEDRKEI